jgi:predicted RNase H-like HicB family nuclease
LPPNFRAIIPKVRNYEEVLENIKDAIRLQLEGRLENREDIPLVESISLTSLEVAV